VERALSQLHEQSFEPEDIREFDFAFAGEHEIFHFFDLRRDVVEQRKERINDGVGNKLADKVGSPPYQGFLALETVPDTLQRRDGLGMHRHEVVLAEE
jgi:hypothetical protein